MKVFRREGKFVKADKGDFFRPLVPGRYQIEVSAPGYMDIVEPVVIPEDGRLRRDFTLQTYVLSMNIFH